MLPSMARLLLITGSPRSSTTALHNALIRTGIYSGILGVDDLDRDPAIDQNFYTDEYYPSMQAAIAATVADDNDIKDAAGRRLVREITMLKQAFPSRNGLMLKAPHYVFGLPAFYENFEPQLRIVFTYRSPFSVAESMLKHPHISKQLPRDINSSTDFLDQFDLINTYGLPDAVSLASIYWLELTLFERALFVWHLYATAFLKSSAKMPTFILRNEGFDLDYAERLGHYIGISPDSAHSIRSFYNALPPPVLSPSSLSKLGLALWERIKPTDDALAAMP
jgi:hypothetical protein